MMITDNHVQLARITPAGDHASIQTLDLGAQYPSP
jgi:hypothetical protein